MLLIALRSTTTVLLFCTHLAEDTRVIWAVNLNVYEILLDIFTSLLYNLS